MEWEASEGMDLTALSDADFLTKAVIIASFIGIVPSSGLILSHSDSPIGGMATTDTRITVTPTSPTTITLMTMRITTPRQCMTSGFGKIWLRKQSELARRGYYRGQINGVIDSDSRQAIRAFQKAQGLPVTGLIDPGVLRALNLPVSKIHSDSG